MNEKLVELSENYLATLKMFHVASLLADDKRREHWAADVAANQARDAFEAARAEWHRHMRELVEAS